MRHPDVLGAVLTDDRHPSHAAVVAGEPGANLVEEAAVDLVDDFQVPRQELGKHGQRPRLQCLGQQRVVGIGHRRDRDPPGGVPIQAAVVDQQAHQLSDGDGRVGVVELDCDPVRKLLSGHTGEVLHQVQDVLQ